jgi:hypothetical protein
VVGHPTRIGGIVSRSDAEIAALRQGGVIWGPAGAKPERSWHNDGSKRFFSRMIYAVIRIREWLALAAACGLLGAFASAARALALCPDGRCEHGYTCETSMGRPGLPEGERACVLALCDADADCAAGMHCVRPRSWCPPGGPDPDRGQCSPPHLVPCTSDTDCGPYHRCAEQESCGCFWGAETPDAPCGCRGNGVFRCLAAPFDCDPNDPSTCPEGDWVCAEFRPTETRCYQPDEVDGGSCEQVQLQPARTCEPPSEMFADCALSESPGAQGTAGLGEPGGLGGSESGGTSASVPQRPSSALDGGPTDAGLGATHATSCHLLVAGAAHAPSAWLIALFGAWAGCLVRRVPRRR